MRSLNDVTFSIIEKKLKTRELKQYFKQFDSNDLLLEKTNGESMWVQFSYNSTTMKSTNVFVRVS